MIQLPYLIAFMSLFPTSEHTVRADTAQITRTSKLDLYVGDWMIDGSREHLAAGYEVRESQAIELRFSYKAICGMVRQVWAIVHDDGDGYLATIKFTFKGKTVEEAATGRWDAASKTMHWHVETARDRGGWHVHLGDERRIEHRFGNRHLEWHEHLVSRDGNVKRKRPRRWDVIGARD